MRALPVVLALGLAASACSGAATNDPTAAPTVTETVTVTTTPTPAPDLPGESFDYPLGARELAVIGVAADDVLNVRVLPALDAAVVATLTPLSVDVPATGRARLVSRAIWFELDVAGTVGWANSSFLALIGATDDITSQVLPRLADDGRAETMLDLGLAVAATRASSDPESLVVVSRGPSVGDLGEITVDVVGLADDSVRGERLVVFGTPDEGGEGFTLRSVERTVLCARGVTDGLCT